MVCNSDIDIIYIVSRAGINGGPCMKSENIDICNHLQKNLEIVLSLIHCLLKREWEHSAINNDCINTWHADIPLTTNHAYFQDSTSLTGQLLVCSHDRSKHLERFANSVPFFQFL